MNRKVKEENLCLYENSISSPRGVVITNGGKGELAIIWAYLIIAG